MAYPGNYCLKVKQSIGTITRQFNDSPSYGMPLSTSFVNNTTTTYGYFMDQLTTINTGIVQSEYYIIDHPNIGNLLHRADNINQQAEDFTYDNLDRLTKITPAVITDPGDALVRAIGTNMVAPMFIPTPGTQFMAYSPNGNIASKTGGGTYAYESPKVHAVKTVTKSAGTNRQDIQNIGYTKFNKAANIQQWTPVTNKSLTYAITYGPDEQRVKTVYTDTVSVVTTKFYSRNYEKEIKGSTTRQIHYITGGTGLVAVYIKWTGDIIKDSLYYVCTDRQGSITALVNQTGKVSERYSYDAWGRRRNPKNWLDYNVKAPRLITRGYTGHEMLDGFGLINMNGRMYDPVIGRVLSPDAFVQAPGYTQSYNRYSYCMNNPLKYSDPSGWMTALPEYATVGDLTWDFTGAGNWYSNPTGAAGGGSGGYGASFYPGGTIYTKDPNSIELPKNTVLSSVEIGEKGVWFQYGGNGPTYQYALTEPGAQNPYYETSGGELIGKFIAWGNSSGQGANYDNSSLALDIGGGIYGGLRIAVTPGDQWLGKNGKYYNNSWGGNRYTGSRSGAFAASKTFKWAGRVVVGATVIIGGIQVYNGYQMDGGQFGYNANLAGASATGSIVGGWAGAEAGAYSFGIAGALIGGPPGTIIGAVVGGIVGGIAGSLTGNKVGEMGVNYYYGR